MPFDWGGLFEAGQAIAQGLIQQDQEQVQFENDRENLVLELQDNERARANQAAIAAASNATSLQAAEIAAGAQTEIARKRILGDAILQQGQAQGEALLAAQQSVANKPERFNAAANALSASLLRR